MHCLPDLIFLDIETTGGSHTRDRITEAALGEVTTRRETLINPEIPIPRHIKGLTGFTDDMVKDAQKFEDIAGDFYSHLEGLVVVVHNARFDHDFLKTEFKLMGGTLRQRTLCTVKLSRQLYPDAQGHSLVTIMNRFG